MHEVSLVHALFDQADRAIGAHPASAVKRLTVRIGELAGVDCELFRTAFEGCREERGYGAATLETTLERAAWSCRACGAAVAPEGPLRCAACDGEARLAAGGELMLDRLELEVADV
ncbi:MAG: hydrogenase maturation nickel metallochaperone HypA [Polyangiaceae bacterium]|nr:hydrogenase maturation nickel metallochaperone HypA [Polyangiaceae bacterium]MBK8938491.1 hydrogenase maturation nickel metallochaperone HypA [Polyangiaceae bacterium]